MRCKVPCPSESPPPELEWTEEEEEDDQDVTNNLAEILNIDRSRALELLSETDNNPDAAAALYFAQQENLRGGPSNQNASAASRPDQLQRAVQEMGLPSITHQQAIRLLRTGGNSVARALENYIETPSVAGDGAPTTQSDDEPIVIASSSDEDEDGPTSDSSDSDQEGSQDDEDGGTGADAGTGYFNQPPGYHHLNTMLAENSSGDDDDDDDDDDDGTDSSSDESEIDFENEAAMWAAACTAYDERFQQEVLTSSSGVNGDGNAADPVTNAPLPSLERASYRASRTYSTRISREKLPFQQFRKQDGSLYAPHSTDIPTFAPPLPGASRNDGFLLGSVLLPVHSVNPTVLYDLDKNQKSGTTLEWSSTAKTVHDFVVPVWEHANGFWAHELSSFYHLTNPACISALFKDGMPVQLSLGGPDLGDAEQRSSFIDEAHATRQMPAVTVRSQGGWMKQFISCLGLLEQADLISPKYTLVRTRRGAGGGAGGGASGSGGGGGAGSKRANSSSSADNEPTTTNTASGSNGVKKAKVGVTGKATTVVNKISPPPKQQPYLNPKDRPLGPPMHVQVAVYMSKTAIDKFYNERTGDIVDLTVNKRSPEAQNLVVSFTWTHYSKVLSYLLSALLTHGQGTLRLGPDSDGLFNVGDIPKEEADQADRLSGQQLSSQFNVANILNSISVHPEIAEKRGLAPKPKGMRSKPKKYQLSGLKWMLDREQKGDARDRGHLALHPAWWQFISQSGVIFYVHRVKHRAFSYNFYTAPPQGTCGGFICDEMGLGKSLQTLMLVQQNPPPTKWAIEEFKPEMLVSHTEPIPIKTTLLVAPTTLLTQWEEEIGKHLAPGVLTYGRFVDPMDRKAMAALMQQAPEAADVAAVVAGKRVRRAPRPRFGEDGAYGSSLGKGKKAPTNRTQAKEIGAPLRRVICALPDGGAAEIQTLDICLCSYEDLRDQLGVSHGNNLSPLQQFGYWRVCLDEAQLIANSSSVAAVMASSLWRRHAWVVTGTPISSRLSEVRGLLEFLALEPYFHNAAWNDLVQAGCDGRERHGLLSLRSLLRGVMLRRSKQDVADELDLPPCVREDLPVVLSTAERAAYERLKRDFLDAVKQYRRHQEANANFVRTLNNHAEETQRSRALTRSTARAYGSLVSLRQSTCHPQMVASNAALMGSERLSMSDIIDRLVTQAYSEFDGALRTYFDNTVYKIAIEVCMKGENPAVCFDSVLQLIEDNTVVAGLLMLPRNLCISLRKENGVLNHQAAVLRGNSNSATEMGQDEVEKAAQKKLLELESVDLDECDREDEELEERREVYRQQLTELAEKWDVEIEEKEAAKKKQQKGGKKSPFKKAGTPGASGAGAAAINAGDAGVEGEQGPTRKAPSFKAMRFARNELGSMPDLPPKRRQLRREAAGRRRNWERFKLAILELKMHLLKEELGTVRSKWTPEAKKRAAQRKESGESDPQAHLEAMYEKLDALRAELGLIPDFGGGGGGNAGPSANGTNENENDTTTGVAGTSTAAAAAETAAAAAAAGIIDVGLIRRSRRQAGIEADSETEIILNPEDIAAQLENAVIMVRTYKSLCGGRDPIGMTQRHVATALNDVKELFHRLNFVNQQHQDVTRMANSMKAAAAGGAGTSAAAAANEEDNGQDDSTRCPICFDDLTTAGLTMTRCSHRFCTDCIREALTRAAPHPAPCPICRTDLEESDLFEAISDAEAMVAARAAAATNNATAEYGAKVAAVLDILRDMQDSEGPGSKCLIFSSWGRALRLVGDALSANKVRFASLAGSVSSKRADLLNEFMHDPDCTVLLVLMSTSGGAAGLTLTMASTAILLEPCINPGLEAQAAARIYRMGQTKPTRVVRLIAEESVDVQIAEQQRRKVEAGDSAAGNIKIDEADYGTIVALADRLAEVKSGRAQEDAGPAAAGDDGAGPSRRL